MPGHPRFEAMDVARSSAARIPDKVVAVTRSNIATAIGQVLRTQVTPYSPIVRSSNGITPTLLSGPTSA